MTKLNRPGTKPKNYLNENLKRVHQIERVTKLKAAEKDQPPKQLWKSKRFEQVPSRFRINQQDPSPVSGRSSCGNFLRAHSKSGPPVRLSDSPPPLDKPKEIPLEKLTIQPASQMPEMKVSHRDVDFIKINSRAAKMVQAVRPMSSQEQDYKKKQDKELRNYKKGQVPKYLKERQIQWEKEEKERLANLPDPSVPEGHRVLAQNERLETLALLKENEASLLQHIQKLSLSNDSLRAQRRRQELEKKIAEVDEAIKIFSRPKVFVKIE